MDRTLSQICDLLLLIVRAIVDNPSAVVISAKTEQVPKILELRVAPRDLSRLIGRKGKTVEAVRAIISSIAHKMGHQNIKVNVEAHPTS